MLLYDITLDRISKLFCRHLKLPVMIPHGEDYTGSVRQGTGDNGLFNIEMGMSTGCCGMLVDGHPLHQFMKLQ